MKNIIAGTAGHIDHGKTELVRALTGIDTDRLAEEKRRGISIDLGFAHLELPGLRIGFVDVPGHERFVRNMLAGSGGIDLVLLVIGADESIKPQTREHFDICRLLGIERGLVVLTKADLVDSDILGLVKLETEEFVHGSFLEGAPVVPVSSITRQGIDELKLHLTKIGMQVRGHDSTGQFRLPLDRSFTLRGFGTVVTGTLTSGSIALEDGVEVHPGARRLRVRGLQVHGGPVERAYAGQRTAVNLPGIEATELGRGLTLTAPGLFQPAVSLDASVELLAGVAPLKHGAPVHFHSGTAEVEAEVRPLGAGFVRILLRHPVLLWPGDRFILRKFSPVVTIGGGRVLDIAPPPRSRKAASLERARRLAAGEALSVWISEAPLGLPLAEVIARSGWRAAKIEAALPPGILVLRLPQPWFISGERAQQFLDTVHKTLAGFHETDPLQPGMSREEVRARVGCSSELLQALLASAKEFVAEGDLLRLAEHKVALAQNEDQAAAKMENLFREAGLAVPAVNEVLAASGIEPNKARTLLQMLLRQKRLVRVNMELIFHAEAVAALKRQVAEKKGQLFTVGEFKDWTGISRKYAIPLLEFLDRERLTRRDGDHRIVL